MLTVARTNNRAFNLVLSQAEPAVRWFVDMLGLEDANIVLRVNPRLMYYAAGACGQDDNGDLVIMINPFVDEDVSLVVAHEIIHCHQMYRGDLRTDADTQTVYWRGVPVTWHPGEPNLETPWEDEAYAMMHVLHHAYIASTTNDLQEAVGG